MKKIVPSIVLLACLLITPGSAETTDAKKAPSSAAHCIDCLKIRVGLPRIARGPSADAVDMPFTEMKLPDGRFRGFPAAGVTYAIDGSAPWDMGGTGRIVLRAGEAGSMARCGQWLVHVESVKNALLGWVYQETACNYKNAGQTHSSTSLATSRDGGLTWQVDDFIVTGKENDKPAAGLMTGEGCESVVNGGDGYYYASCKRNRDKVTYIARAPIADPKPGNWKKYFKGAWTEPGVGGDASKSGSGGAIAQWLGANRTVGFVYAPRARMPDDKTPAPGGMTLAFSSDHINFAPLAEPLILLDGGGWARPNPYELLDYWSLLDAHTGSTELTGNQWNLFYMDIQPNEGFDKRYLVARPIEVSPSRHPDEPQVGVLLGHWYDAKRHEHWSTIAAVPGSYVTYQLQEQSGHLMTLADGKRPAVELEDCVMTQGGHADHILAKKGACENRGYTRQRSVGWVYSAPQPNTQPLYSCYSEAEKSHFAAIHEDCDRAGKMEALLGYDLKE